MKKKILVSTMLCMFLISLFIERTDNYLTVDLPPMDKDRTFLHCSTKLALDFDNLPDIDLVFLENLSHSSKMD